jgi:hypothetical protein
MNERTTEPDALVYKAPDIVQILPVEALLVAVKSDIPGCVEN